MVGLVAALEEGGAQGRVLKVRRESWVWHELLKRSRRAWDWQNAGGNGEHAVVSCMG